MTIILKFIICLFISALSVLILNYFQNVVFEPEHSYHGKIVYQKNNPNLFGLVMKSYVNDVQIWWENQMNYDPYNYKFNENLPYFYKKTDLVIVDDSILSSSSIYRQPNNSAPQSLVIGKQICHNFDVGCYNCYVVRLYWKHYWLLTTLESDDYIAIKSFKSYECNELFNPNDPCFKDINYIIPRRCVIKNCCKIAFEDSIPSYCHC